MANPLDKFSTMGSLAALRALAQRMGVPVLAMNLDVDARVQDLELALETTCAKLERLLSPAQLAEVRELETMGTSRAFALHRIATMTLDETTLRPGQPFVPPPKKRSAAPPTREPVAPTKPRPAPAPMPSLDAIARRIQTAAKDKGRPISFGEASAQADELLARNRRRAVKGKGA